MPFFCAFLMALGLEQAFQNPPDDARIMMRWWWFGPAVTHQELEREMRYMKEGGIGGFEVQPVYPLTPGPVNLPYLSKEFLEAVRFTSATARRLGLRMDMTLGSGWPFGGPHIPIELAAGRLRIEKAGAAPKLRPGESIIAEQDGLVFIAGHTGMMVKRAAVGAEGFVLDHYNRAALDRHLEVVGEKLAEAGGGGIRAVFCDSLEVFASDWTGDFLEEFRKRRGYDLKLYLPALARDIGEKTRDIRHDWGQTLTELYRDRFLAPLHDWCRRHNLLLRVQSYGIPPADLSSYALVDIPEGEGAHWNSFSTTRWGSSAGHNLGRPVISSETWTWLRSPVFRATPLDIKAEADQHFLEGINQLIGHGWPYSPEEAGEPGWSFYAAGVFNHHNPWWLAMPDLARYLQRVSFMLRQGQPVTDIGLYLPTDDAWADFTPGRVSLSQAIAARVGSTLIPTLLEAGYSFDFIDDQTIVSGRRFPVVVLPRVERMPAATKARLRDQVVVEADEELARKLKSLQSPDVSFSPPAPAIGFVHRRTPEAEIYFLANTGNRRERVQASFRVEGKKPEFWDPFTGEIASAGSSTRVELDLEPYGSRFVVFTGKKNTGTNAGATYTHTELDLSRGWEVTFEATEKKVVMDTLRSWTDDPDTRFYSGRATYRKTVALSGSFPRARVKLDFGEAVPVAPVARAPFRAWVDGPVREAAEVWVNGKRAGVVWHPPYEVDVTALLRKGTNEFRVVVANLAVNRMAGKPFPDYKELHARYGKRFDPQDLENLQPVPAGLLGSVRLVAQKSLAY